MPVVINGSTGIATPDGSASVPSHTGSSGATNGLYFPTSTSAALATNGAVAVTISSSQYVGIASSSPTAPLTVGNITNSWSVGSITAMVASTALNAGGLTIGGSIGTASAAGSATYIYTDTSTGVGGLQVKNFAGTQYDFVLQPQGGNLGLGVTPSAWGSGFKAIDLGNSSAIYRGGSAETGFTFNSYYNGTNYTYKLSAAASVYEQVSGAHKWYNAPSGTAGNPITFTQAMTLDASGNLGIGTTGPSSKLHVGGNTNGAVITTIQNSSSGSSAYAGLQFLGDGASFQFAQFSSTTGGGLANQAWLYTNQANSLVLGTNNTARVTIDSSGNVGIGTSSPGYKLHVAQASAADVSATFEAQTAGYAVNLLLAGNNAGGSRYNNIESKYGSTQQWYIGGAGNDATLVIKTGGTERARIDSSGNLLVGTTSSNSGKIYAWDAATGSPVVRAYNDSASFGDNLLILGANRNTTNNSFYAISFYNYAASAYKFRVADSGNCTNANNSYTGISDIKLKQDIVDASSQWNDIKALRVRKFHFKDDVTGPLQIGVIAQEIETTSPGLIDVHPDRDAEGNDLGTVTKAVKYSVLYMKAVKALQEAILRIEALEAKVQ